MMKTVVSALVVVATIAGLSAEQKDVVARFEGAIGVDPVGTVEEPANPNGTFQNVSRNIIRGVRSGGVHWRIADLTAELEADGHIVVEGRGLLVASGNSVGQTANQSVFATVVCEAGAPFTENSTPSTVGAGAVRLEPNGDFLIDDTLRGPLGELFPQECPSPALLIRSASSGTWFAVGIPKLDKHLQ